MKQVRAAFDMLGVRVRKLRASSHSSDQYWKVKSLAGRPVPLSFASCFIHQLSFSLLFTLAKSSLLFAIQPLVTSPLWQPPPLFSPLRRCRFHTSSAMDAASKTVYITHHAGWEFQLVQSLINACFPA